MAVLFSLKNLETQTVKITKINYTQYTRIASGDNEVCQHWLQRYHNHPLVERLPAGQCSCQAEVDKAQEIITKRRTRLADLSWLAELGRYWISYR